VEPFDGAWVLVIEDDRDQAELCAGVGANAGLNAMTVGTGLQGYWKAHYLSPAVIILDLLLPDADGWEICRRLKTDNRTNGIPIVTLTARDKPNGASLATAAGCAADAKKPCPPPDLVDVVRPCAGRKQAETGERPCTHH
jgi:DNA-binding response OmpR family regulator